MIPKVNNCCKSDVSGYLTAFLMAFKHRARVYRHPCFVNCNKQKNNYNGSSSAAFGSNREAKVFCNSDLYQVLSVLRRYYVFLYHSSSNAGLPLYHLPFSHECCDLYFQTILSGVGKHHTAGSLAQVH